MKDLRTGIVSLVAGLAVLSAFATSAWGEQFVGKGEWRSLSGESIRGTWAATLVRNGKHVQGNLDLTGSNVFSGGSVSGDLDASSIVLGVMVDGSQQATFRGKLDAGAISGEWECDVVQDSGVWFGTLDAGRP